MTMIKKTLVAIAVIAGVGTFVLFNHRARTQAKGIGQQSSETTPRAAAGRSKQPRPIASQGSWDGLIVLTENEQRRIGLRTVHVKEQVEPCSLKLAGTTDYDPSTLTIVRAQFDSRADKVLVNLDDTVKKGDPLIELFSTDLAEAKSVYEAAVSQWTHDKRVLEYKTPLAKATTLPMKELIEIENDEAQSRLRMKLARDKLLVHGLTEQELEATKSEDGVQKARMILRSRADGIVIKRALVLGNYYDAKDELLTIAPLDHLWVRGSVNEIDADKVEVGQNLRVIFPYANRTIPGKVEHIERAIDPETRAARFRTSISNPKQGLKAGMFVRVLLDIAPLPGRTVIPRMAMISVDRHDFVFIRKPGTSGHFERRAIAVVKESNESVIVGEPSMEPGGLLPNEEVVTSGSLILEQMFEDRITTETGIVD
ncbi:membrane fusion protein, cobalt-zinc-cadmium efflux system [Singulisphaera sp. GP187]|uniref:efflux RND transporter periplasmic adaptor subunit n=1 Tax=Singulisphaera sp. GP187 TaxID=1882752 RepID=UPI0009294D9F|nr:efflux RND transporter periplasmic adaptor subunit [Singulisphaera sp. GP187]SIO31671.1 membrane fusion protein, cobalt-zinc-cadmium efflux system [Singulisphaera sp. GP187]